MSFWAEHLLLLMTGFMSRSWIILSSEYVRFQRV
jgi:hypothetical protein